MFMTELSLIKEATQAASEMCPGIFFSCIEESDC